MKKNLLVLLFVLIIVCTGCTKETENPVNNNTVTQSVENQEVQNTKSEEIPNVVNEENQITTSGEIVEESGDEIDEYISPLKDLSEYFVNDIYLGIAVITNENEEKTMEKYTRDKAITIYNFGNNTEYTAKFLIVPKDESVSFDLSSCLITEDGEVQEDMILASNIEEPIILKYDDYESITPQYCIILKRGEFEDLIPLVFSGYDGSLDLGNHKNSVVDLTIYE